MAELEAVVVVVAVEDMLDIVSYCFGKMNFFTKSLDLV
jgi:hypothetical protein